MARAAYPLAGQRAWARRRARARALLVSIGATVFVLAFCVSGTVGYLSDAALGGIRSTLETAPAGDASVVLRAPAAKDAAGQNAGVRSVISAVFDGAPLKVARSVSTGGSDFVSWTITPIASETTVADLGRLSRGYSNIESAVTKSRAARSSAVELSGHGQTLVATLVRAVGAQQTIEPIPLTALALAGIVALLLARSLLTDSRQNETRLLRSRGASAGAITALDTRESLVVCLIGSLAGCLGADAALFCLFHTIENLVDLIVPPLIVFVIAVAIAVAVAGVAARSASGAPKAGAGRRRATAPLTVTGFGLLVVVIALWRFEQNGTAAAAFDSDPSAVLAPGALLCAAVLLCLLVGGQVTGRSEALLRRRGSVAVFPVRSVNRHVAIIVGPTALLAIALALATVTGAYSGTWQRFAGDSEQLTTGGDLRASVGAEPVLTDASDLAPLADFAQVRGVQHAAVATRQSDTFGDLPVTVIGVSAGELPDLIRTDSTVVDARQLARQLTSPAVIGIALPAHASALTLTVTATATATNPAADSAQTTLWLGDAHGNLFPANFAAVPFGATAGTAVTVALPASENPWTIEALDVSASVTETVRDFRYAVSSVSAQTPQGTRDVPIPPTTTWTPRDGVFSDGTNIAAPAGTLGFSRANLAPSAAGNSGIRIMPAGTSAVSVVLSRPFATATGLVVGSKLSVAGQWAGFNGVVTGIVANVPGASSGDSLIASLNSLDRGWLETSEQIPTAGEVWMSSSNPAAAATRIRAALPNARVVLAGAASGGAIVRSSTLALWIGTIGTSAFAIVALVAAVLALLRRRAVETRALRAMGLSARRQASLRQRELAILSCVALLSGLASGAVVALLVSPTMARLSTPTAPGALPLRLQLDPLPLAATAAALFLAILCSALAYGVAVRRQAGDRS